jgi:hypothetical protein
MGRGSSVRRRAYLNMGWESWNSPPGQIVTNYIRDSLSNGYIPVFDWYEAGSQSNDPRILFANLSTPSFMHAYFASYTLMLKKAGAFGSTVMWSFMQQQASSDPSTVTVSVASSGFPDASDFPNTAAGFAQALVAMRNTYAPNVLLAWDNSAWAVDYDVTCYDGCWNTPAHYGAEVASFYEKLGAKFDLIFFNTSDRDSGFKEVVLNQPSSSAWWHREYLVVELKHPDVKINAEVTAQIESYAFAVAEDERFRAVPAKWVSWAVSSDMDQAAAISCSMPFSAAAPRSLLPRAPAAHAMASSSIRSMSTRSSAGGRPMRARSPGTP